MATIKAIEGRSVHQIQSGQVIVDLNSVAKELVENALDAGATSIEVRFKNNGLDSIEVQDNGSGIAPEDYDTIALKHYTSKLSTYDDLSSLQTFGFRGEALSSLCALSKFNIITARASDGPKGTKLDFEQSGKLKGTSVVAAKQGTTVVVDGLFHNLPVRRKELEKTIKRQYQKVLDLLHAYACISVGVKFSVSNIVPKGKKTVAFSTQANPNTKENIANVYGAKTLLALIPLDLSFDMDPTNRPGATQSAKNWSTQEEVGSREVRIVGHISRPVVGEGRQTPDRQMFFVNSRPCELPQVKKAFNEVYKGYNITQSAFIFADMKLDTNAYDVNVSPDKRSIMLHDQTALLESLKTALADMFEGHDQSVPQAQLLDRKLPSFKPPKMIRRESTETLADGAMPSRRASDVPDLVPPENGVPDSMGPTHAGPGFVKASLIERFAGRDSEERTDSHPNPNRRSKSGSVERPQLPASLQGEDSDVPDPTPVAREASPLFEPEPVAVESRPALPRPVQDFNARIAEQHAKQLDHDPSPRSAAPEQESEEEESIPSIKQTPQRNLSQSTIQNAFDRMRPMRTPAQQATITIGDTTTVSTIGSTPRSAKRARIHTPKFSLNGTPLSQTPKKPLFIKSLRGFAAPGTQIESSNNEDGDEHDEEPESSMSLPRQVQSPSPTKRKIPNSSIGPSTDNGDEVPSTPPLPLPPLVDDNEGPSADVDMPDAQPPIEDEGSDEEYIDESEKKAREEAKIVKMIEEAEEAAARPTEKNLKKADRLLTSTRTKFRTIDLVRYVETSPDTISRHLQNLTAALHVAEPDSHSNDDILPSTQLDPEERLSLTVTKADFSTMRIIGQFNLGFILAVRPPSANSPTPDLFIIDQHASDEKYNFERFAATTVLDPQRLVHPHPLQLTAIEEEIILSNSDALTKNGFRVDIDTDASMSGHRAKLTSLPMSKEAIFSPSDLEELLSLLLDNPPSTSTFSDKYIPRPSKVRKLLASRACRKSVMIGKTLKTAQMERIVAHMGEMDKPWSCPHGRPTMRHLYALDKWQGWREGDGVVGVSNGDGVGRVGTGTDWKAFLGRSGR